MAFFVAVLFMIFSMPSMSSFFPSPTTYIMPFFIIDAIPAWSEALDGAPLTAGILASCVLCTLAAWYGPPQAYRALVPSTSDGPWLMALGLLTSALVHGDLFHIVFNGFWVLDIGTRIERARGITPPGRL